MDITFQVKNQIIRRTDNNSIVQLSENYLCLKFSFTDDWNDLVKFILIKTSEGTTRIALVDDSVVIPAEFLDSDKLNFSVYGVVSENDTVTRITTNKVGLILFDTGYTSKYTETIERTETDLVEEIYLAIDKKSDKTYVDAALEGKSDVGHTHVKSDITDFSHNHDERYYTESEVDEIIENVRHDLNNRLLVGSDRDVMQTGDKADITAYVVKDGMPQNNKPVYFYAIGEESNQEEEEE